MLQLRSLSWDDLSWFLGAARPFLKKKRVIERI
jgi:hypothetical protein